MPSTQPNVVTHSDLNFTPTKFQRDTVTYPGASGGAATQSGGVTRRVVVLALALAVLFGYIIPIIDIKLRNTYLGGTQLPAGGLAVLLILLLIVNPVLWVVRQQWQFARNEILTIYITCLFSCLVPGVGAENFLVPNFIAPFYYATRENRWLDFLLPHLKPWFTPAIKWVNGQNQYNEPVITGWFTGTGAAPIPWSAWLVPLIAWGVLVLALYTMMGCLSVLLRAQWGEHEALSFPLLRVPLELTEGTPDGGIYGLDKRGDGILPLLFYNRLMWIGFAIAVLIQGLNGLNLYFPDVPRVPLSIDTGPLYTEPPWNQIAWATPYVYPMAVGISYLLASEVSLSLWFFFWFFKLQLIMAYYLGYMPSTLPTTPTSQSKTFVGHQQIGAFLVFAAIVLWTGREHFSHILQRVLKRAPASEQEKGDALSYPVAFWGFVLAFAFIVGWSIAAGIRPQVALVLWLLYLVIAICLTRVVAEGGLLFVVHSWLPLGILGQLVNSGPGTFLPPESLVPAAFIQSAMMNMIRGNLMPSFVQSFKLAHDQKIRARPLLSLICAVTVISMGIGLWMNVRLGYHEGALQLANNWYVRSEPNNVIRLSKDLLEGTRGVSWTNWVWLVLGGLGTYGMMLARSRFPWFALHPIGYLMGLTYPMHLLWFSTFLGWLCKLLITRFGGVDTYRKTTPLFLGLVLGDIAMVLLWLLIDGWQGRTNHQLMPG
ncbi:MAG: hypothetical protein JO316_25760 [Abitibacteriaceae bacterium]|nr:hypothetical protein [Abditibacteriaceae bacterium]